MRLTTARVVLLVLALLPLALGLRELQQTPAKLQGKITINKNVSGVCVLSDGGLMWWYSLRRSLDSLLVTAARVSAAPVPAADERHAGGRH